MKKPQETKTLLNQALGLNAQERTLLLDKIDDNELKSQVETLLADKAQLQVFLNQNQSIQPPTDTQREPIGPGSLINRIRIIKLLGQGGMGSVYLGFDEKLERQVAVKSIRPEHLKNQATQQRFIREAQILSKINHPSICQLYDYLETPDGDFLVLEYIKGKPLYQSPLTDTQKLTAMADLAAALSVAHEHGIVHRDLKPDNIMITDEGQLKVLDFGIAQSLSQPKVATKETANKISGDLTQHGSLVGTIRYMSPEQAQGKNINTASDQYALGIIVQEVFSHQAAYQVMETEQLLADVQQGKRIEATGLPEPITNLIKDLTQLDPTQRPTAQDTVKQINTIINAPKFRQKKIIKYSIISTGLVLLLVLLWQWQQFGNQAARNESIKKYETQINALVQQAEQIFVLPIHPVDEEIKLIEQQGEALYIVILNDALLTETDKKRLMGIILLKGELYADAITLLTEGQAESQLLADAWTMLYIEKATEFSDQYGMDQTMTDNTLRENYLNPALKYIEQVHQDAGQVDPLFQAFVLSQTTSLDAGLQAVNQVLAAEHWNKKAVNLKALILSALMTQAMENGQWEQAKFFALKTAETYQISNQMARSFPPSYISLCYVSSGLMRDAIHRSGEQVVAFSEQAIGACENALKLQPNNKYPMQLLTNIYMMKAQWEMDYGTNPDDSLSKAKHWNQQGSSLDDLYRSSWTLASILAIEAKKLMLNGEASQNIINQALDLFNNMMKVETEFTPYVVGDMLFVLALQAHDMVRQNQDPSATFQRAQALFDQSMLTADIMVSEQRGLINNMTQVYRVELLEQFEKGQNILPLGQKLLAFLNPTENRLKNDPKLYINLANTHLLMAEYLRRQQQPIKNHLSLAADYISQALAINPNNNDTLLSQASLMTLQSYFGSQDYTQANQIFEQVMASNPNNPYNQHTWGESLLIQAQKNQTTDLKNNAMLLANEKINKALSVDENNQSFINSQNELLELAASIGVDLKIEQ